MSNIASLPKTVIELNQLSFSYGLAPVLENITLQVQAEEFLGIVGPNAGGKSTLLKLILGQLKPMQGSIKVMGHSAQRARHCIGYVPQYPAFHRGFPITVEQVVLLGRLGYSNSTGWKNWLPQRFSAKDHQAVKQALLEVEADDLAKRQIDQLSGGQLQRVLLARALVAEPRLLILDEPTANIDQRLESDIFDLLKQLNQRMTILVVSHDIGFVSAYVNRVACINRTLVCHHTDQIDANLIQNLYNEDVRMVAHHHHH